MPVNIKILWLHCVRCLALLISLTPCLWASQSSLLCMYYNRQLQQYWVDDLQYDRFLDGKERFVARSNQEMAGRTLCSWKCHSSKPKDSLIIIKTHMAAAVVAAPVCKESGSKQIRGGYLPTLCHGKQIFAKYGRFVL